MAKISMDCKQLMVKEISTRLNNAPMLIVTNYKGLTSQDLNELRRELRNISDEFVVIKDSMAKRAFVEGPNKRITDFIEGEVGIAVDRKEDPSFILKTLVRFSKNREVFKIRGGIINGEVVSKEDIATLAALPSRKVLLGKLANVLNAPIQGLASALHGIISKIVYALNAVKDKKQETGNRGQGTSDKEQEVKGEKAEKTEETQAEKKEEKTEEKKEEGKTGNHIEKKEE